MDQPKIERVLRLMRMMSGSVNFTVDELAEKMDTSYRTIYRYIETFKDAGFVVEKQYGSVYRLMSMPKSAKDLSKLVYFSEEEARVLASLIQGLDTSNGMKANLFKKLAAIYDITSIDRYTDRKQTAFNIQLLEEAMKDGRQVCLKDYGSASSGRHDAIVEPFDFTGEYVDVWAYDVEKKSNRMYKIARIGSVEILTREWQHEKEHMRYPMDVFRMCGPESIPVKLEMDIRAKNLLCEEYPLAEGDVVETAEGKWVLDTKVTHLEGVGRFVMGLASNIRIIDSPQLKEYICEYSAGSLSRLIDE